MTRLSGRNGLRVRPYLLTPRSHGTKDIGHGVAVADCSVTGVACPSRADTAKHVTSSPLESCAGICDM